MCDQSTEDGEAYSVTDAGMAIARAVASVRLAAHYTDRSLASVYAELLSLEFIVSDPKDPADGKMICRILNSLRGWSEYSWVKNSPEEDEYIGGKAVILLAASGLLDAVMRESGVRE